MRKKIDWLIVIVICTLGATKTFAASYDDFVWDFEWQVSFPGKS